MASIEPTVKSAELPNGIRLPYVEQGEPASIPMLLLHAYVDSWRSFERVLPYLPGSIHAIAPTQRGHGDADRPAAYYRPHDFAADLAAFMDALQLGPAVVVGSSSAGLTAQRFAIDAPERTLGVVLVGTPLTLRDKPAVAEFWEVVQALTDPLDPDFVRQFVTGTVAQPVPPEFLNTAVQESLKVPARVWKAALGDLMEVDFSIELSKIKAPTLLVWGDQDAFVPRSDQEAMAAAIPDARLVVYAGGGHVLHWEEPERFAADLVAFAGSLVA